MIVEWRIVDGGLYNKSPLLNFSSGGLAVTSDEPLKNGQALAFRLNLATGPEYVMGEVRHSRPLDQDRYLTGVTLDFLSENGRRVYESRVRGLKERRPSTGLCHF